MINNRLMPVLIASRLLNYKQRFPKLSYGEFSKYCFEIFSFVAYNLFKSIQQERSLSVKGVESHNLKHS